MSSTILRSWLNSLARAWSGNLSTKTIRTRRPRRTQLEVGHLEDRLVPSTIVTLAPFNGPSGTTPLGTLFKDSSGNLFGTAYYGGGANNDGTVFELAHGSSTITALATFDG